MSSVNIQSLTPTGNQVQDIQNLFDAYARLRKELVHGLSFLDEENVPVLKTIVGDIEGAYTAIVQTQESIDLLATDVAGNTSAISVQAGQIQSLVTSVNGQASSITQLSNEISLKVSNSQYTASVIVSMINGSSVTIEADNINLNGVTTMDGLAQVYGTLRVGTPYATASTIILGGDSQITSGSNTINITPNGGSTSGILNLYSNLIYANTAKLFLDELRVYSTVDFTGASVSGLNVVAKFG